MSQDEIRQWMELLGRTSYQRLRVLNDLWDHRDSDRMSPADRRIVQQCRSRLMARLRVEA